MAFRSKFENLVAELSARTDVQVTVAEFGFPASEAQLATARRYLSHALPPGLETMAQEMNGFHLEWEGSSGDRGAVKLLPIERIFGSWKNVIWFPNDPQKRFADLFPFDFFQPEVCIAFRVQESYPPDQHVQLHAVADAACPLACDFSRYIDLLLESRAYVHWQQTLSAETQGNPEATTFRTRAKALFPDLDLDKFTP